MERSHAGVEERRPDRLRVRVGDLEDTHHRGAGLERSACIHQAIEGARELVAQPIEERNTPRSLEEVHGARLDPRLRERVGHVLHRRIRVECR